MFWLFPGNDIETFMRVLFVRKPQNDSVLMWTVLGPCGPAKPENQTEAHGLQQGSPAVSQSGRNATHTKLGRRGKHWARLGAWHPTLGLRLFDWASPET